eukprot:1158532-Pelagomonas_calceolata.AAC.8
MDRSRLCGCVVISSSAVYKLAIAYFSMPALALQLSPASCVFVNQHLSYLLLETIYYQHQAHLVLSPANFRDCFPASSFADFYSYTHTLHALQILAVALLNGKMHYCADEEDGEYIDPYYVLPEGQTIVKDWCAYLPALVHV